MMDSMVCYFHSYMVMRWSTVTCTGMVVILPVLMLTGVSKDPLSIWRRNSQRGSGPWMMKKPHGIKHIWIIWTMKNARISINFMPPKAIFCIFLSICIFLPFHEKSSKSYLSMLNQFATTEACCQVKSIHAALGKRMWSSCPERKREIRIRSLQMDWTRGKSPPGTLQIWNQQFRFQGCSDYRQSKFGKSQ